METKKAILLVSVGTSHLDVLDKTTNKIAQKMEERFPEEKVYQAFSGEKILGKMREKQPDTYYNVEETLEQILADGMEELSIQPAYIISGMENERLCEQVKKYREKFKKISLGKPLFHTKEDYQKTLDAILEAVPLGEEEALMLVGHGTNHHANTEYQNLEYTAYLQGNRNVFVSTLEGHRKHGILMRKLQITGCKKVRLMPLLLVAGKHAKDDIAGEKNSWKSLLEEAGYEVEPFMRGMGELDKIQDIFIEHLEAAMKNS